jgi:hypothetical protein
VKRRTRILIVLAGILVLAAVATHLYLFEAGGLETIVVDKAETALGENSPFSITVGDIKGNMFTGITFENVAVRYFDSTVSFECFHADRITARYSLKNLLNADYSFSYLLLENPTVIVIRDSSGIVAPSLKATGAVGSPRDSTAATEEQSGPSFSLAVDELRVTGGRAIVRGPGVDSLWFDEAKLVGAVEYANDALAARIMELAYSSSNSNYALSEASGKVTYSSGNIVFQELTLVRGSARIKLDGSVDLRNLVGSLDVNADNLDLEEISALTGGRLRGVLDVNARVDVTPEVISARANLGGQFLFAEFDNLYAELRLVDQTLYLDTVYGTILDGCGIDGSGEIAFATRPETYRLSAEVRNFNLAELVRNSFESDLSGRLEMHGESFSNETLLLRFGVNLYESSFDEYPLQAAGGPLVVTTDSLWFPEPFTVDYFENRFTVEGTVIYSDDLRLKVEAELGNLDRYRGKLFIDQPGGRGYSRATLSGKTDDPDLKGWFASDSLWIYGLYADTAYAAFDIERFLTGRKGTVEVSLFSGAAWQVPYDSGYAGVRLDSVLVYMDTIGFQSQYAGLATYCHLDQGSYPWQLSIDSLHLSILQREFFNRSHLTVEIDSLGFDFKQTAIGHDTKSLAADRRINFDETMDVSVAAADIQIADWLQLFQRELDLAGVLSANADLKGSFAAPEFVVSGTLDSIFYRDVNVGTLTARARYRDGLLTADSMVVHTDSGGYYEARGHFPANLAFTAINAERLPDLPFDLTFTARDRQFDLLYLFLPSVEYLQGDFSADCHLTGTVREPHLDGQARLINGSLKYFDLVDRIRTDSASVLMVDKKIYLDTIHTYVQGKNGTRSPALVTGDLTFRSLDSLYYDLDISIPQNMPFRYDLDDIEGVVRGHVQIEGETPPKVSGDLVLDECLYRVEFASDVTGSPLMLALSGENTWDLDINIEIPSKYSIKNQDIDAEFGGYLNVIREKGRYRFIGELKILRGKGYLFDKTFRFAPDSARVIFEDIEYFNPRLDIWATSRIPVSRTGDEERSNQDLRVHVTGTLESPEYSFYEQGSDAALSYSAIVPLIAANYYGDETGGSAFEARISSLISSQVSQIGSRHLGVETFEIDPTYDGNLDLAQTRVTLGVYTSPSLYLWGRSDVGFGSRPEAGFEYRFSRELMLEGYRDEDQVEGESYHLNFKLHLEW